MLKDVADGALSIDKEHIQAGGRIFHPHGHRAYLLEVEQHARPFGNVLAEHIAMSPALWRIREFNIEIQLTLGGFNHQAGFGKSDRLLRSRVQAAKAKGNESERDKEISDYGSGPTHSANS